MSSEVQANRSITQAYIQANPTTVTLIPRARVRQPNGSWKWQNQTPRLPQTMRVIEQAPPSVVVVQDGTQRSIDYVLLAEWDAKMAKNDVFLYGGDTCTVVELYHHNGYEIRGSVVRNLDPE